MEWNAQLYLQFEAERTLPAEDLARSVARGFMPATVLDVGCGPGNSTAVLQKVFPEANIIGADASDEMLMAARKALPGVEIVRFDANGDFAALGQRFDLIFSNACFQWVPDHPALLHRAANALAPGGMLAVQVPRNYAEPVHTLLVALAQSPAWRGYFTQTIRSYDHVLTPEKYAEVLSQMGLYFRIWETIYWHMLPGHRAILDWYRGTGLRPYLDALPEEKRSAFEEEFLEGLQQAYVPLANGAVPFRFPRLFFIAQG